MSNKSTIVIEQESPLALITLNRPAVHNAVNAQMMDEWERALDEIAADDSIQTIIICAAGESSFCAGGDLRYFATLKTAESCRKMSVRMQKILNRLYLGNRFVIAAVNGQALGGGCEILTACHYRIAADNVSFAFRQAPNGIITGWGGGERLLRQLPRSTALRLLLTGERFSASDALRFGFIDEVVAPENVLQSARQLAELTHSNDAAARRIFVQLSNRIAQNGSPKISEWETEQFVNCWMGETFQQILNKFA